MARGDIKIDYDTNDLIFNKSATNVVNKTSLIYDSSLDIATLRIEIPEDQSLNDAWKTYEAYVDGFVDISVGEETTPVNIEYFYTSSLGQAILIKSLSMSVFEDGESEPTTITVADFRTIYDTITSNKESLRIKYFSSTIESFFSKVVFLGDFYVKDDIQQNQYILLNINEGALLQNPTYGVGVANYAQSPTSDQDLLNTIVEKFAQDLLRVTSIKKLEDSISVESEDFNRS